MPRTLSEKSVDRLIELARVYCEARAVVRVSQKEGRLTPMQSNELCKWLSSLEDKIGALDGRRERAVDSMRKVAR